MGLMSRLKKMLEPKSMWEVEKQRRRNFELEMARTGYELASAKRQERLAKRHAEIAKLRKTSERLAPAPKQSAPSSYDNVMDALDCNPLEPSKKSRQER